MRPVQPAWSSSYNYAALGTIRIRGLMSIDNYIFSSTWVFHFRWSYVIEEGKKQNKESCVFQTTLK